MGQVIEMRYRLENAIYVMLREFSEATGIVPTDVSLQYLTTSRIDTQPKRSLLSVSVRCEI